MFISRLRLSVLPLRIQTGRYARNNIPRNERYCQCCQTLDIEDEYHFVCVCSTYNVLRRKYLKRCYYIRPSVFKYHQLLITSDRRELINLSKFVKESLKLRNTLLNNIN